MKSLLEILEEEKECVERIKYCEESLLKFGSIKPRDTDHANACRMILQQYREGVVAEREKLSKIRKQIKECFLVSLGVLSEREKIIDQDKENESLNEGIDEMVERLCKER